MKRFYSLHVPNLCGHCCIGSSGCWLVTLDRAKELHLVNPVTGTELSLPSLTTLSGFKSIRRSPNGDVIGYLKKEYHSTTQYSLQSMEYYYRKVIVSSSQESRSMMVFVIFGSYGHIAYARPGDESWNELGYRLRFQDITLHKGRLYGVCFTGDVVLVGDVTCPTYTYLFAPKSMEKVDDPVALIERFYLVESADGKDLMVVRRRDTASTTNKFLVFRLDSETECEWVRKWNLGESALFVGENQSMALSTHDFPELERNCIYFSDVRIYWSGDDQLIKGTGVFHMSGNNITPCYDGQFRRPRKDSLLSWHLWLLPAVQ